MIHQGSGQNALKAALTQVLCETSCPNLCHSELHLSSVHLISLEQGPKECPSFFKVTVLHLEVKWSLRWGQTLKVCFRKLVLFKCHLLEYLKSFKVVLETGKINGLNPCRFMIKSPSVKMGKKTSEATGELKGQIQCFLLPGAVAGSSAQAKSANVGDAGFNCVFQSKLHSWLLTWGSPWLLEWRDGLAQLGPQVLLEPWEVLGILVLVGPLDTEGQQESSVILDPEAS